MLNEIRRPIGVDLDDTLLRHPEETIRPGAIDFLEGLLAMHLVPILDTWSGSEAVKLLFQDLPALGSYFPPKNRVTATNRASVYERWLNAHPEAQANPRLVERMKKTEIKFPPVYGANILVDDLPLPKDGDQCHYVHVPNGSPNSGNSGTSLDLTDAWVGPALEEVRKILLAHPEGPDISKMFPEPPIDPKEYIVLNTVPESLSQQQLELICWAYNRKLKPYQSFDKITPESLQAGSDQYGYFWKEVYYPLIAKLNGASRSPNKITKIGKKSISRDELAKDLYEMTLILLTRTNLTSIAPETNRANQIIANLQPDMNGIPQPIRIVDVESVVDSFRYHILSTFHGVIEFEK